MKNTNVNRGFDLHKIIINALLIAFTVVISRLFLIPIPLTHGNINLCDTGIFIAAAILGPRSGFAVGAISGAMLDVLSGFTPYALFSLVIHGMEGYVLGALIKPSKKSKAIAYGLAGLCVVVGYFIADSVLYSPYLGYIGIATNLIQVIVNIVLSLVLIPRLGGLLKGQRGAK